MKIVLKKKINGNVVDFEVNERDYKESMLKLGHLLEDDYCWLDGFKDAEVKWRVKKAVSKKDNKSYTYIERHCWANGKHAKSTLGQYQDNSGYFWKKWELVDATEPKTQEDDSQIPF